MGNAIKFTHTSDQKEGIIIARVSVEAQKTKRILVNIKDNGIGIKREKQKLLFHPFVQADDGDARHYDGTGLGLSISSKLVKLMGGDIGFKSDEGEGAEFYFKLPFNPEKSQPIRVKPLEGLTILYINGNSLYDRYLSEMLLAHSVSVPTLEDAENAGTLILIVEDNISNQIVLKKQLNLFGFQSVVAGNGQKALEVLRRYNIALVLCDCQMPDMDGYEFTEAVRMQEAKTDTHLTIIAVTANAIAGEKQKCLDAGMDDYLSKPVELQKLAQLLNHWLPTGTSFETKELKKTRSSKSELPVNVMYLESIIGNNKDNQIEIMRKFLHSVDENSRELEKCVVNKKPVEIKAIAHKLKSSSKAVGAIRLAEYLQALEDVAMTNSEETINQWYSKINQEFDVVTMFVKRHWEL